MPSFRKFFSITDVTESVKLLPWYMSTALPYHFMGEAVATTTQQSEDTPTTATMSELEGLPVLDPSSSPTCPPRTHPFPLLLLPDSPFEGTLTQF